MLQLQSSGASKEILEAESADAPKRLSRYTNELDIWDTKPIQ